MSLQKALMRAVALYDQQQAFHEAWWNETDAATRTYIIAAFIDLWQGLKTVADFADVPAFQRFLAGWATHGMLHVAVEHGVKEIASTNADDE